MTFTYTLDDNGRVQVSIKLTTYRRVIAHNMTWYNATGAINCEIEFNDTNIKQTFTTFSNSSCNLLSGTTGNTYDFDCTVRYQDSNNIEHVVRGNCKGIYE